MTKKTPPGSRQRTPRKQSSLAGTRTVSGVGRNARGARRVVTGVVRFAGSRPAAGLTIVALDKRLRTEQEIQRTKTDTGGGYRIEYVIDTLQRTEKRGGADLVVRALAPKAKGAQAVLVESRVPLDAPSEVEINLDIPQPATATSEIERHLESIQPLLAAQGAGGADLPLASLTEPDIDVLARQTMIDRQHIGFLIQAAISEARTLRPVVGRHSRQRVQSRRAAIPAAAFYAWFRLGMPTDLAALWARSAESLMDLLALAIERGIVPESLRTRLDEVAGAVQALAIEHVLAPAEAGTPPSLGDLLATMPEPLQATKTRIVAEVAREPSVTDAELTRRLKERQFSDEDIGKLRVTRALGDVTGNHVPLMRELQKAAARGTETSLRHLASIGPAEWLELAVDHGTPATLQVSPEIYAAQLEQGVEARYPTAVFAARVQSGRLELKDRGLTGAVEFLAANPALELQREHVRTFVESQEGVEGDKEPLIKELERIQRVVRLGGSWHETGVLLNSGYASSLDIVHRQYESYARSLGQQISVERAAALYGRAQRVHDTTLVLLTNTYLGLFFGSSAVFSPPQHTEAEPLHRYPNLRTLFGNLTTCFCEHCQSVLSPAAYLVDLLRFLDTPADPAEGVSPALEVLLRRRPDVADLELTCTNTKTEIPYIDLVLEVLENAIGLPIDVESPYGFDPEVDFEQSPLPANIASALRRVLKRSAISISERLEVRRAERQWLIGTVVDWLVTDGARHWVLRHHPQSFTLWRGPIPRRLTVDDEATLAALGRGELPSEEWLIPADGSMWDKHLPMREAPAIEETVEGRRWTLRYTRAVRVVISERPSNIPDRPVTATLGLRTIAGAALYTTKEYSTAMFNPLRTALRAGRLAEPLIGRLPADLTYEITGLGGDEWEVATHGEVTVAYVPQQLRIAALTYQTSASQEDLKAMPENLNPEAYRKLAGAVYPWTLPFDLWLQEVRVFLERRGLPRRELMERCDPSTRLGEGTVADALARELLDLSLAEFAIVQGAGNRSPWEYWGLEETGNSVVDVNDTSDAQAIVSGSWTAVLSVVSILVQRSGLSYRELLNVLQTGFMQKQPTARMPSGAACNPSRMSLPLSTNHLDRLHRLVRIWRTRGGSVFDLDRALNAVTAGGMDLNAAALRGLARLIRLEYLLGVRVGEVAAWWGGFTAAYTDYTHDVASVVRSPYERLYLNATIVNPIDRDFLLNAQATELDYLTPPGATRQSLAVKGVIIATALGITQAELEQLTAHLVEQQELAGPEPAFELAALHTLFRHVSLARSLHLTIRSYLLVKAVIAVDPFESAALAIEFVERIEFVRRSGFSIEALDYLLQYRLGDEPTPLLTVSWLAQTLTSVRGSLRNVRRQTLESAEPAAEQLRKVLVGIGWFDDLVEAAVQLFAVEGHTAVRVPGDPPPAVTIPAALAQKVAYESFDGTLTASLTLTAAEWAALSAANVGAAVPAIAALRTKVDAFAVRLAQELPRMQSFDLRTQRVSYDPQNAPVIAAALSDRCYFDPVLKELRFTGWMTDQHEMQLRESLPPTDAAIAATLKAAANEPEPSVLNRFLFDLDAVKELLAPRRNASSRVAAVLERAVAHLERRDIVERLSQALDLSPALLDVLLSAKLSFAATLGVFLDVAFIEGDGRAKVAFDAWPDQFRALCRLHKAALICRTLRIEPPELDWLPPASRRAFAVLAFNALPADAGDAAASFVEWQQLVRLFQLRDERLVGSAGLRALLLRLNADALVDLKADLARQQRYLAETLDSSVEDIRWAAEQAGLETHAHYVEPARLGELGVQLAHAQLARALNIAREDVTACSDRLGLVSSNDYQSPETLTALYALLAAVQRLGIGANEAFSLIADADPTALNPGQPGQAEAALARQLLRARYDEQSWPAQLQPIADELREKRREALVSFLITQPPAHNAVNGGRWKDANDLYDHFLIDVEMRSCKMSARILHAISAVQLFVQRCLLNIEEEVTPAAIDAERWKWIKNYRVWEANRKVFLYPENWIEPELRDDKSELFEELEGELQQNEFDNERAEEILKAYLKELEDIAHLAIVGLYVEKVTDRSGDIETRVHIVGRTRNRPARFFYRRWLLSELINRWEPWEHLPLDGVKSDHILPFVLRGDVYIAWPEITQLASEPGVGDPSAPGATWRVSMAWVRRTSGGWAERCMSHDVVEHPWIPGKSENQAFTFRVLRAPAFPEDPSSVAIDCFGARESNENIYSFSTAKGPTRRNPSLGVPWNQAGEDSWTTVTFKGVLANAYTESGNKVYRWATGVTVRLSLTITGDQAIQDFNHEFYWRGHGWPWNVNNSTLIIDAASKPSVMENSADSGSAGEFSVSLRLITQAIYRPSVLSASPTLKLELVGLPANRTPQPIVIQFKDEVGNGVHTSVTLNQNVVIDRGADKLPGADPDRRVQMQRIARFMLFSADDATFAPASDIVWSPPPGLTAQGSGYLAPGVSQTADLVLPDDNESSTRVALWNGVGARYYLTPSFPVDSHTALKNGVMTLSHSRPEMFVYRDQSDSYFVRAEDEGFTRFQVVLDGHPSASRLRRTVAQAGVERLFSLDQQQYAGEPALAAQAPATALDLGESVLSPAIRFEPDDSRSPYAGYNTELFFHTPFLIATFLSANQRHAEAQAWFHFVFDPTSNEAGTGNQRYWRYVPFRQHSVTAPIDLLLRILGDPTSPLHRQVVAQLDLWLANPFRPHAVARMRPRAYEFAVVFKYLDNLIAWGDRLFRQYTTESINEATQLYVLAAKLLGPRPQSIPRRTERAPLTYRKIAGEWDLFANAWMELESGLGSAVSAANEMVFTKHVGDRGTTTLTGLGMPYFCIPPNEKMLEYWDKVENRLFNIRHCRNIDGIAQEVPLWQPPIDPALLVRAVAAGLDLGAVLSDVGMPLPYYRFEVLARRATELCSQVKALGAALLSSLEKKDAEQLSLLRSTQELTLIRLVEAIKQAQIDEARANVDVLKQSEELATVRFMQYQRLLGKSGAQVPDEAGADVEQTSLVRVANSPVPGDLSNLGMTQAEQDQMTWSDMALALGSIASVHSIVSGILYAVPDVSVGTPWINSKFGGTNLGSILSAGSAFWTALERIATHQAARSALVGQYQRRQDEWMFQSRLALKEIQQIRKQKVAAEIRHDIAVKELASHKQQIRNAEETDRFMREKYTNQELYNWMTQQIAGVYFRTYRLAFDVARRAEQSFRFELGLTGSSYVQTGYWDGLRKGLLAGERLEYDLKRMEVAYLDQNRREYEITKHVSLLSLDAEALVALRESGRCEVSIPEVLFDLDHPGHYLRRIKAVSVTIPCVTGPYVGVNCTLTLLQSSVRKTADYSGTYARTEDDSRFVDHFGPVQSVVISSGQNDGGLFETNLRDERYLPFEGAGVIGRWRLELPDQFRAFDYATISDVILHMRYTARNGGDSFKTRARAELQASLDTIARVGNERGLVRLFNLKNEFPSEWHQLRNAAGTGAAAVELAISKNRFPFMFGSRDVTITLSKVRLYAAPAAGVELGSFPATLKIYSPPANELQLTDIAAIGRMVGRKSAANLGVVVAAGDDASKWRLEIPRADFAQFRATVDDILMVCDYSVVKAAR